MRPVKMKTRILFQRCIEDGAQFIEDLNNPVKINGDMTIIYCAKDNSIYECIIDTEDLFKVKNRNWSVCFSKQSKLPRPFTATNQREFIYTAIIGNEDGKVVDHINGDTLDNRKCNLRLVTPGQNMLNKRIYCNSKFGGNIIQNKDNTYTLAITRKFKNIELAKKLKEEIFDIINKYSWLDADGR